MTDTATPLPPRRATGCASSASWNPNWEPFYELDPEWTEKFMRMAMTPMLSGVLDAKTIEFLAIAVDASCTHMYGPGVRRHIRKALELGATQEEITAVLQLHQRAGHPHDEPGRTDPATKNSRRTKPRRPPSADPTDRNQGRPHAIPRRLPAARKPATPGDPGRPLRPRIPARRLRRHPGDDGRAGAKGGGLLERRRHRAARACAAKPTARAASACRCSTRCWRACAPRCPKMVLQVGGSISFAPEGEGADAKWLERRHAPHAGRAQPEARPGDDRHQHQPDEHLRAADAPTTWPAPRWRMPAYQAAYREMTIPSGPGFVAGAPEAAAGQRHPAALHAR